MQKFMHVKGGIMWKEMSTKKKVAIGVGVVIVVALVAGLLGYGDVSSFPTSVGN